MPKFLLWTELLENLLLTEYLISVAAPLILQFCLFFSGTVHFSFLKIFGWKAPTFFTTMILSTPYKNCKKRNLFQKQFHLNIKNIHLATSYQQKPFARNIKYTPRTIILVVVKCILKCFTFQNSYKLLILRVNFALAAHISRRLNYFIKAISQSAFTCSKLIIETPEQGVKYVQN